MQTFDSNFLERELSRRTGKNVTLKGMIYSSEEGAVYRNILIEGEYSGVMFDLEDLTEYEKRGILDKQLDRLANKLKEQI